MVALQAGIETIRTRRPSEQIHHRRVSNVLEASSAVIATLVPVLVTGLDIGAFGLQNKHRSGASRAVAFGPAIGYKAGFAQERSSHVRRKVGVYG